MRCVGDWGAVAYEDCAKSGVIEYGTAKQARDTSARGGIQPGEGMSGLTRYACQGGVDLGPRLWPRV